MNVNLWFARDVNNEIISILNSSNDNTYTCPICTSKVIPKALESKQVTPHFAHIDREKCSSETMLHWWFKHKFIERGDTFTIVSDEKHTYTCKDFKTEVTFNLESGVYRPDIVIETECGNEIVFEMANTNKKKVQDYIDRWIELDRIVVEVDIKSLQSEDKTFNALYYSGKCFNFNKREIKKFNKLKEMKDKLYGTTKDIEIIKSIDWLWREVVNYHKNKENIEFLYTCYKNLNSEQKIIVRNTLYHVHEIILENDYNEYIQKKLIASVSNRMNITEISRTFTNINKLENSYSNGFYIKDVVQRDKLFIKYDQNFNESVNEICEFLSKIESNESYLSHLKLKNDKELIAYIADINETSNYDINFYEEEFSLYRKNAVNVLIVKRKGKYYEHILHVLNQDTFSYDIDTIKRKVQDFLSVLDRIYVTERKHKTIARSITGLRFHYVFEMVSNYNCTIISEYDNYIVLGVIDKYDSKNNIYLVVWGYKIYLIKDTSFERIDIQHQFNLLEGVSFIDLKNVKMNENIITDMINDALNNLKHINIDSCKNCFSTIILNKNEYKWFLEKDFNLPKICDVCRKERKKERLNG